MATDNITVVAYINKEGGIKSGPLCALLWRILTWCTRRQVTQSSAHPRLPECNGKQTILTRPNHSNRMVPSPRGFPNHMLPVAPAPSGLVCHQVQQLTATVCVTSSRPPGIFTKWMHSVCPGKIWTHMPSHQQPSWEKWWRICRTTHVTESY